MFLNGQLNTDPPRCLLISRWHNPRRKIWTKIISLLISITFIFPVITWAFDPGSYSISGGQVAFNHNPIKISGKLGEVMQTFQGDERLVVLVHDLHCNFEVQNNIAKMIDALAGRHGLKLVNVEAASEAIDVSKLSTFPVDSIKKEVAEYFMKQGKITGAEAYASTGKQPIRLEGIEDETLYRDNRKTVMKFLNNESQGYICDLREMLNELKPDIYNQALKDFDAPKQSFRQGDIPLLKYCVRLHKSAAGIKENTKVYKNLNIYILERNDLFSEAVDSDKLYKEIDALDLRLRARLYTTPEQEELDVLAHRLDILEKLLNISAAPEELAEYRANPEAFKVKQYIDYIARHTAREEFSLSNEVYALDRYLEDVKAFYQVADIRSLAFVDNTLAQMDKHNTKISMLITGGFHAEKVLAELKRRGVSYLSVKPRLKHQDIVNPYFSLLRNQRTPLEKLLAQNQNILGIETAFRTGTQALSKPKKLFYAALDIVPKMGVLAGGIKKGINSKTALSKYYNSIIKAWTNNDASQRPAFGLETTRINAESPVKSVGFINGPTAVFSTRKIAVEYINRVQLRISGLYANLMPKG
ncbi:hypothetical protein KAR10_04840, partial [bacterium]|nr:hypothetical protein [bacterium]